VKVVGYTLSVPDNGTFMFRDASELERCEACGYVLTFMSHNPAYQLRKREADYQHDGYFKRGADLSATYDSYYVASKRFRDFCLGQSYEGLIFLEFAKDKNNFNFMVKRTVKFDARRRGTVFERLCRVCKSYESVVGATPSYLLRSKPLRDGFYRSDLLFGSGDRKSPDIFVGVETKSKLEAAKLKGLTFLPAYGVE
jgi:hypothetical protein